MNSTTRKKEIGERIKKIRLERNLTQEQFSTMAGITRIALGNYERGERSPTIEIFERIAKALHVTTDELLGYSTPDELTRKAIELQNLNIPVEIIDDNVIVNKTAIFKKESFIRFVNSVHSIPVYRENVRKIWLDFLLYALSDDLFSNYRHLKESNELDPSSEKIITTMLDAILPEITNSDNDIIHKYLRNTPARLYCPTSSEK